MPTKTCVRCETPKETTEYGICRTSRDGLFSYCKPCKSSYNREKKYGLTADEVNELLARGCENCGSFEKLHIDHDHASGEVRGCLCNGCNTALGLLGEDADRIAGLADYIKRVS
jgi:hypothetical protein